VWAAGANLPAADSHLRGREPAARRPPHSRRPHSHMPHSAQRHLESEHGSQAGVLEELLEPPVVLAQQVQHIHLGKEGQQVLQGGLQARQAG
jgi:hypothetical protein